MSAEVPQHVHSSIGFGIATAVPSATAAANAIRQQGGSVFDMYLAALTCSWVADPANCSPFGNSHREDGVCDMSQRRVRARDVGFPFSGLPGAKNSITDVAGVEVGHTTLVSGEGSLIVGQGPVRTGVTAILPRGRKDPRSSFAGSFALNAAGEVTGLTWVEERGYIEGPILITNTHSVGIVRDAAIKWMLSNGYKFEWTVPVVGETYDGILNDINGFHVRDEHVYSALNNANSDMVLEGNVGGGTGMICYEYKGGIGSSSRVVEGFSEKYTVGVLVQANYGRRKDLRIAGVKLSDTQSREPETENRLMPPKNGCLGEGSIIVVIATDAPLLPHQLKRLAKRPSMGIARLGGIATEASGEIFVAFSTANAIASDNCDGAALPLSISMYPNAGLTPFFEAAVDATEEAILNAMVAAECMIGINGYRVDALPYREIVKKGNANG
ncbi:P1 family peptidase [Ensifer sp. P24N7]|uniref:DmpA family aminopeptidase n=1 Tax=Sinorhizobium sp. P24N7 TaxID=3348358 RepID=UPI0035F2A558